MKRAQVTPILATLALIAAASLAVAPSATAKRGLKTGIGDTQYLSAGSEEARAALFDETRAANAAMVRLDGGWRHIAGSGPPASPGDPADPAYNFSDLDAAVRVAHERGLEVMITIAGAPNWAERGKRPRNLPKGTWKPDPAKLASFARAVARRYSGNFVSGAQTLPRVRSYEVWNEPNLPTYLTPQYVGKRQVSARLYMSMLNKAYRAIKSVHPSNRVVAAGTAPYGDPRGGKRTRPLVFIRKLFCLSGGTHLRSEHCRVKARFDVLDHHPITFTAGPRHSADDPDDAAMGDLDQVRRVLRFADRKHTVGGPRRHQLWVGEFWWQSKPPDAGGVPLRRHARWYARALYEMWRQGANVAIALQIQDSPAPGGLHTGLLFADGSKKPAFDAFRFPFVVDRKAGHVTAWGKAPRAGQMRIQRKRRHGWTTIARFHVGAGRVFQERLRVRGKAKLRAAVAGDASLPVTVR